MGQKYKVVSKGYCGCHPETCCCDPWRVIDSDGDVIATYYNRQVAEKLISILEKEGK